MKSAKNIHPKPFAGFLVVSDGKNGILVIQRVLAQDKTSALIVVFGRQNFAINHKSKIIL